MGNHLINTMKLLNLALLAGAASAYEANDKVQIDLYYEAYCPYCRDQIVGNFKTALETPGFAEMATVTFHPYGNAHESANSKGEWAFTCQHGPTECQYNTLEACAWDQLEDGYPFVECVEASLPSTDYDGVATACAKKTGVANVDKMLTCFKGVQGNSLEHKYAVQTDAIQSAARDNLLGYVCTNYKGANKAKACNAT